MAPRREDETRELIEHLRVKRSRRRWTRLLLGAIVTLLVVGGLITGVVLATAAPGGPASGSTSSSMAEVSTTRGAVTTETTAGKPVTTEPTTTEAVTTAVAPSTSDTVTTAGVTTTSAPATTTTANWLAGKVIVIDPGHQAQADSGLEPIGPGSSQMKAKVSSGTSSVLTGIPESQVVLTVGLKLRSALQALGVQVLMTRTTENVDISNTQRAKIGNAAGADLTVRLHCNGATDRSVHGSVHPLSRVDKGLDG